MKYLSGGVVCLFLLGAAQLSAVDYSSIAAPGVIVTGVRSTSASTDDVLITGSQTTDGITSAVLYSGSLAGAVSAPLSSWVVLAPSFDGQTITSATLYGPNTFASEGALSLWPLPDRDAMQNVMRAMIPESQRVRRLPHRPARRRWRTPRAEVAAHPRP